VDVNRAAYVGPMVRPSALAALNGLLSGPTRRFKVSVIANAGPGDPETAVRVFAPGAAAAADEPLGIPYRRDFFSLGHVALPFPLSDGLYGANPDPLDDQGVSLGALATRGETGVLSLSPAALARVSSNPFLPWMFGRIDATLATPKLATPTQATGTQ
ncbi:MAG: hypothetical protein ACRC1J_00305, partial [Sandaracinobacteroides sp.]